MANLVNKDLKRISPIYELYRSAHKGDFYDFDRVLYHYTSPDGLLGITCEKEMTLYFTQYSALNDASEGKVLKDRFIKVCNRLLEEGEIEKNIRDKMVARVFDGFRKKYCVVKDDNIVEEYDLDDLFVCSFSKNKDSLPLWNYYVKSGDYQGYNLGFKSPYSHCSLNDDILIDRVWPFEVCYSDDELYEKIRSAAIELNEIGMDDPAFFLKLNELDYYLTFSKLKHKLEYFAHEEEVRLVFLAGKDEKKNVKYRTKNGLLIPYLEINFFPETLREVTMGPLIERELAEKNLRDYLIQKGYSDIRINSSNIPIRY